MLKILGTSSRLRINQKSAGLSGFMYFRRTTNNYEDKPELKMRKFVQQLTPEEADKIHYFGLRLPRKLIFIPMCLIVGNISLSKYKAIQMYGMSVEKKFTLTDYITSTELFPFTQICYISTGIMISMLFTMRYHLLVNIIDKRFSKSIRSYRISYLLMANSIALLGLSYTQPGFTILLTNLFFFLSYYLSLIEYKYHYLEPEIIYYSGIHLVAKSIHLMFFTYLLIYYLYDIFSIFFDDDTKNQEIAEEDKQLYQEYLLEVQRKKNNLAFYLFLTSLTSMLFMF